VFPRGATIILGMNSLRLGFAAAASALKLLGIK
jgi:hypothetical protein